MSQNAARSPKYLMGHAGRELERLRLQSTILEPVSRRLLKEASIGPGQRMLDIGCGTGDVSAMLADVVGRAGRVVGIDVSPS